MFVAKSWAGCSRSEILQNLAERIGTIEAGYRLSAVGCRPMVSLGIPGLDTDLSAGALVELLPAADGAGLWTLALLMARQVCPDKKALVVTDVQRCFYPPAAVKLGVDLDRLIVIRPATPSAASAAFAQALRCPAVGAAVGWHGQLDSLNFRRLQLASEAGGGVGFLLRPSQALRAPSFATLRLLLTPVATTDTSRQVRLDVIRCHGGKPGPALILEIHDETGHVRLPAAVADTTLVERTA